MWYVIPEKSLPGDSGILERLLREVNELVAYYADRKLECARVAARYEAMPRKIASGKGTLNVKRLWSLKTPPVCEVTDYAIPIGFAACCYQVFLAKHYLEYLGISHGKADDGARGRKEPPAKTAKVCPDKKELSGFRKQAFQLMERALGEMLDCLKALMDEIQSVLNVNPYRTR